MVVDDFSNDYKNRTSSKIYYSISMIMLLFAILLYVLAVFAYLTKNENQTIVNKMKTEETVYLDLIENGKSAKGTIIAYFSDMSFEGEKYYYLIYEFKDDQGHKHKNQKTYTNYTYSQVQTLKEKSKQGKFIVKYSNDGYSVTTDYSLENIEYRYHCELIEHSSKNLKLTLILAILLTGAFIVSIVIITRTILKKRKKEKVIPKLEFKVVNSNTINQPNIEEKLKYCDYCGGVIVSKTEKCPSCGARVVK